MCTLLHTHTYTKVTFSVRFSRSLLVKCQALRRLEEKQNQVEAEEGQGDKSGSFRPAAARGRGWERRVKFKPRVTPRGYVKNSS